MAEGDAVRGPVPASGDHGSFITPEGRRLVVRVFPADRRLVADLQRVAARVLGSCATDSAFRDALEAGLREWYPRMAIHPQADLASLLPSERLWYAMRDGRVHRRDARLERLHSALATARDVTEVADAALCRSRTLRVAAGSGTRRPAPPERETRNG